jgi:hypothetical protein
MNLLQRRLTVLPKDCRDEAQNLLYVRAWRGQDAGVMGWCNSSPASAIAAKDHFLLKS